MIKPMSALVIGERFEELDVVKPRVYRVTSAASDNAHGWTFVWDESMTDAEVSAIVADGGAEDGVDPRGGVLPYSFDYDVRVFEPVAA